MVVILFMIKIPNVKPLTFLPPTYATINAITAFVLVLAYTAIKRKNRILHERLMKIAISLSVVFLAMYVAYHMTSDPTPIAIPMNAAPLANGSGPVWTGPGSHGRALRA